jgi:4-alpha-glucanotransferase
LWLADDPPRLARRAELSATYAVELEAYAFVQMIAHDEHDRVHATASALGLALYADLQVGFSEGDRWSYAAAFLPGYVMGAPPSRTNVEGQPWNYPVLDPRLTAPGGAALALLRARADKAFAEYDSLRIDHPHGLVCPWVYRSDAADPGEAVRNGARLFESPDLPDHPALAAYALVDPAQLDRSQPRHADRWASGLRPAQIERYAVLFDEILASAERHGRDRDGLTCEVLSTMPEPLRCVLERHGLGRWRVLQKANLEVDSDVYRAHNARPCDWVMLGNHDTAPIFGLIASWDEARRASWATHLRAALSLPEELAAPLRAEPGWLAAAMLAEALASQAENLMVFFADLFGFQERFNVPGTVNEHNWALRVPSDFAELYRDRLQRGEALNLPLALGLALRARGSRNAELIARLFRAAGEETRLPAAATPA